MGVGRLGGAIAQDRRGVGKLNCAVGLEQLVGCQPNSAPGLEFLETPALRRVVEIAVRGFDVHQLEAVWAEPGGEALEVQAHVDEEVVGLSRSESPVGPVHDVELETELDEDPPDFARFPEMGV